MVKKTMKTNKEPFETITETKSVLKPSRFFTTRQPSIDSCQSAAKIRRQTQFRQIEGPVQVRHYRGGVYCKGGGALERSRLTECGVGRSTQYQV